MYFLSSYLSSRFTITTLTASTLAIAGIAAAPMIAPCRTVAWSYEQIGQDARAGRAGTAGQDGSNGESPTVYAEGTPVYIDISGRNGEDGSEGEDATSPRCGRQHRNRDSNLQAADGANGGNGGRGGKGGDGGTLALHYANLTHLQQVSVDASGGRGGRGKRGGRGSNGCDCHNNRWEVETCREGSCSSKEYKCINGRDGRDGSQGKEGSAGELGKLILIDQLEPLPAEILGKKGTVSSFIDRPIYLSRNLWETRSGAKALLAPGSIIQDSYRAYAGYVEGAFALSWRAPQAPSSITENIELRLAENGQIEVGFPEGYWLLGTPVNRGAFTAYRVEQVVPVDEITRLAVSRVEGRSRTLQVNVLDNSQLSDELDTQFELRYSTSKDDGRRYNVKYEGPISSDLVVRDRNRFTLSLGRLPIRSQLISGGTEARIELIVTRSYGDNATQQTLSWSGRI